MSKMYKIVLAVLIVSSISFTASGQWSSRSTGSVSTTDKAVARLSFPKEFKLFALNVDPLRQQLMSVTDKQSKQSTVISLPNAAGGIEQFEVFEASNFDPALQARFPQIRAFSGKGITDKYATLKLSISPQGIQTMVFRTETDNEFIEPYSQDHTVYAVFKSSREKGKLPWTCSTQEQALASDINAKVNSTGKENSNTGELKTMRLAQSCNGEYSNFFGAFSNANVALVLAAFNATLTRCNGCYEKDLALHLNLIPTTDQVIFYDPATDPYTTLGAWNNQLQATLTSIIGEANYDIGHMFGASGGGGNAGCIGCVCVDGQKGRGITSPADGIPQGDNFDIDYVAHEVGHQLGGNHTFSHTLEGSGQNKEVGSGITIMGYAGITAQDVAPHSIDIFHETSIQQIQVNLAGKTCPITTPLAGNNATPVVAPVNNFTIPISTPFAITASATDANPGDALTYCWEQNDNSTTSGANSVANPTKTTGPNWLSFSPTPSGTRTFPRLSTILAGLNVTGPLPGGDAGANIEALSSVSRTLNFRVTVRDNCPYVPGTKIGQTAFTDMVVTVNGASGPFNVSSPNTPVSWDAGSTQAVTWSVNGTDGAPINCANVKILFSSDGGNTFPVTLIASTPNDGSENVTIPGTLTTTARIKVESIGNIFFDISNTNFTVAAPPSGFSFGSPAPAVAACPAPATMAISLPTVSNGGFVNPITLSLVGTPPGTTTVSFAPNPVVPGNPVTVTLNGTNTLNNGSYVLNIQGTATGAPNQNVNLTYTINAGAAPNISVQPTNQAVCAGANASFTATITGATTYQWQESINGGGNWNNIINGGIYNNATTTTLNLTGVTAGMNTFQYRIVATGQCGVSTSTAGILTVSTGPTITGQPADVTVCATANTSFTVTATGTGLTYQWQESINGGGLYTNITNGGVYGNATTPTLNLTGVTAGMNTFRYRAVVTGGSCGSSTSTGAILTVVTAVAITTQPVNSTVCANANTSFTAAGSGAGVIYQWQISTTGAGGPWTNVANGGVYGGATSGTLTITGALVSMNGYQYRAQASNATCTSPGITNAAILTVNSLPAITTNPANVTICSGSNTSFNSPATGTGVTYQWQESTNGGGVWNNVANGGVYSGATTATLNLTGVPIGMNNNQYRLVATGTCAPAATSTAATLTVIAPVVIGVAPTNKAACANDNTSFTVTATSVQTVIYQWQVSTDGGGTWNNVANGGVYGGATTATLTITGATTTLNNNRYRVQASSATCGTPVISGVGTLTVHALPTVGLAAAPLTSLTPGKSTTLTATPSAATAGSSIVTTTWYQNGTLFNNPSNTYLVNVEKVGGYQVRITETWTDLSVCNNQSSTVTIDATPSPKLFIYPNPTNNGQFTVSYYNTTAASTGRTVTVYGAKGERVYTAKFNVSGPYTLLNINLTPEQTGIFIVVVGDTNGKKLIEGKVIVH